LQEKYHLNEKKTTGDEAVAEKQKQKHNRITRAQRNKKREEKRQVCEICNFKRYFMTLTVIHYIIIIMYDVNLHKK